MGDPMATTAKKEPNADLGPIEPDVLYPLAVFQKRTGFRRESRAKLRREGLPIRRVGRQRFVLGRDFIEFVLTQGDLERGEA